MLQKTNVCMQMVLLFLFSFLIILSVSACGGPAEDPKTVVDHYYTSMEKGDYQAAIQYLQVTNAPNPSMNVTTAGELQTMDTNYGGPIKSYKINGQPSVNGQTASVNVTVTRSSPYTMNVQLTQINGKWIITGADVPNYLY